MSAKELDILLPGNAKLTEDKELKTMERNIVSGPFNIIKAINMAKDWSLPMAVIINKNKIIGAGTGGTTHYAFIKAYKASKAFLEEGEIVIIFNKFINADTIACIEANIEGKIVIVAPEFDLQNGMTADVSKKVKYKDFDLVTLEDSTLLKLNWNGTKPKSCVADFDKKIKVVTMRDPDRDETADIEFARHIGTYIDPSIIFASALHTCCIISADDEIGEKKIRENMTWENHLVVFSTFPFSGFEMDIFKGLNVTAIAQFGDIYDVVIKTANCYDMSATQCEIDHS